MGQILLIDDDVAVLKLNHSYLTNEGHTVKSTSNIRNALKILQNFTPECIVLDIMMPSISGFEGLPLLRQQTSCPIIFLSGKAEEDDRIHGLLLGADDYITKPYSLKELSLRINLQITRTLRSAVKNDITVGLLSLDIVSHKAFYQNEEIILANKEYDLLYLLVTNPNKVITFEEIGHARWGTYTESDRRTIMVTASRLRKKLEEYPTLCNSIETVYSKGYLLHIK